MNNNFSLFLKQFLCHKEGYWTLLNELYRQILLYWSSLQCLIELGSIWKEDKEKGSGSELKRPRLSYAHTPKIIWSWEKERNEIIAQIPAKGVGKFVLVF